MITTPVLTSVTYVTSPIGYPLQAGPPGSPGASAYQIAQAAGYSGTQTQWLASLVGPAGPPGPALTQAGWIALLISSFASLPTTPPGTSGQPWNNGNFLCFT